MACYHPLKAVIVGETSDGKKELHFFKSFSYKGNKLPYPVNGKHFFTKDDVVQVPCGKCIGCRLDYSRQWANRCMLELQYHDSAYFVTLTYDDLHVPISYYTDDRTGEAFDAMTLKKRDFQLFMKRLRKNFPNDEIRYFMCGEYGGKSFRPHYHAIIYGLHLDDLVLYKKSPQGFSYYNSKKLESLWYDEISRDLLGFVVVTDVTWETCAYVARYVLKKAKGVDSQFYEVFNIVPEFTLMSRRPGIARQYYDDHPDIYEYDYINLKTERKGLKFKPPRYYDSLYDNEHPAEMQRIKEIRKRMADEAQKIKLQKTSLDCEEYLSVEESNKLSQIKSLRRSLYA